MFDQIKPFENGQTVYAFPYFDSTCFDELTANLPPEILSDLLVYLEDTEHYFFPNTVGYMWRILEYVYSNSVSQAASDAILKSLRINFSLLDEKLGDMQFRLLSAETPQDGNRPFFYEFFGHFVEPQLKRFLDLMHFGYPGYGTALWQRYYNSWSYPIIPFTFYQIGNGHYPNDAIFHGTAIFSSSPITVQQNVCLCYKSCLDLTKEEKKYLKCKLTKWYDDLLTRCHEQNQCNIISNSDVCTNNGSSKLNNAIQLQGRPTSVKVHNVGQANHISICFDSNQHVQFDIGITKDKQDLKKIRAKHNCNQGTGMFCYDATGVVILSHWDLDHISGVTDAGQSIYQKQWIVPSFESLLGGNNLSLFALTLMAHLQLRNNNNLYIIAEDCVRQKIYDNGNNMQIWTGQRARTSSNNANKKYSISAANNFGLIVTLTNNGKTVLLPGDCDYEVLPDYLKNQDYDCLVVPHHCSKMSKVPFPQTCQSDKERIAIISYGKNNYKHPNVAHKRDLKKHKYEIKTTAKDNDITFSL